jgi:hypothetical protein
MMTFIEINYLSKVFTNFTPSIVAKVVVVFVIVLQVQEHGPRVFNGSLDCSEEGDSLSAVDKPVIVRQGQVHHRTNHNLKNTTFIKNIGQRR